MDVYVYIYRKQITYEFVTNTLQPRLTRRHFADDILKFIFLYEYVCISSQILLKFVLKGPVKN